MLTYFSRALGKKGFTIAELTVVIAIIGVLAGIGVPSYIDSQRRAERVRHNDYARGFYLSLQQSLMEITENDNTNNEFAVTFEHAGTTETRRRITPTAAQPIVSITPTGAAGAGGVSDPNNNNFFLYVEVNDTGGIAYADLAFSTPALYVAASDNAGRNVFAEFPAPAPGSPMTPADRNNVVFGHMMDSLGGYMRLADQPGFYYAMFDTQFRVVAAYYSQFVDRTAAAVAGYNHDTGSNEGRISRRAFGAFPEVYGFNGEVGFEGGVLPRPAQATWFHDLSPRI